MRLGYLAATCLLMTGCDLRDPGSPKIDLAALSGYTSYETSVYSFEYPSSWAARDLPGTLLDSVMPGATAKGMKATTLGGEDSAFYLLFAEQVGTYDPSGARREVESSFAEYEGTSIATLSGISGTKSDGIMYANGKPIHTSAICFARGNSTYLAVFYAQGKTLSDSQKLTVDRFSNSWKWK